MSYKTNPSLEEVLREQAQAEEERAEEERQQAEEERRAEEKEQARKDQEAIDYIEQREALNPRLDSDDDLVSNESGMYAYLLILTKPNRN